MTEYTKLALKGLVHTLSDLLDRAIATQGELSADEWTRMEIAQRRAYAIKHPEMYDRPEGESE